jgi:histidyl-tRNA synthetase
LSRQLEDASARGFTYAVIVGRKEMESKTLTLKDLAQRKERNVASKDLVSELRSS